MIMFHLKIQIVLVRIKYKKTHIMTLIKLKVSKAKVSVFLFKNMKLMKNIFQMKSFQKTAYKKLRRLNK